MHFSTQRQINELFAILYYVCYYIIHYCSKVLKNIDDIKKGEVMLSDKNRRRASSVVLQGSILAAAALISRVIGFLYKIPLANILTDEGNGYYANAATIYSFFLVLSTFSFPIAISKLIAEKNATKQYHESQVIFKSAIMLAVFLSIICSLLVWFVSEFLAQLMGTDKNIMPIRAVIPSLLFFSVLAVIRGYFQGMNYMMPTAISQIIEQMFNLTFSLLLASIMIPLGVEYAAVGGTLGTGIGALAALLLMIFIYLSYEKKNLVLNDTINIQRTNQKKVCFIIGNR